MYALSTNIKNINFSNDLFIYLFYFYFFFILFYLFFFFFYFFIIIFFFNFYFLFFIIFFSILQLKKSLYIARACFRNAMTK